MPLNLKFRQSPAPYAIVRLAADAPVPAWAASGGGFISTTRTPDELSIVCPAENIPTDIDPIAARPRWACLKLEGPFPFSQTGVLLSFIEPLSNNEVPIFAISTYETDYVFIPQEHADRAVNLLRGAGHAQIME